MIHRSSSSPRRKGSRQSSRSPHRSTGNLVRKSSVAFGSVPGVDDNCGNFRDDRRTGGRWSEMETSGSRYRGGSSSNLSDYPYTLRGSSITVTSADERVIPLFSPIQLDDPTSRFMENAISLNEYPRKIGGSATYDGSRSCRNSVSPDDLYGIRSAANNNAMGRKSRSTLLPEMSRSSRSSLVPDDAYSRGPRGSIDPSMLSRGSRNSLFPDPELYNRSSRPSMVADVTALRNSRNSLGPDMSPNRSPRNSLVPAKNRSPRGSLVPESNRSPRSSLVPDANRTPRGSLLADASSRTPRGSVTSEGSMYSYNRSSRSSLPLQDNATMGKSPRGSIASASAVQFDLPVKTPRGSIESAPPGTNRLRNSQRCTSPLHSGTLRTSHETVNTSSATDAKDESRRASSNVSQVGVSTDDRRQLCEHTKLNAKSGLTSTPYGSFVYQLNHENMESTGVVDFVLRAMVIVYRTDFVTVFLVCLTVLPVIMLIMGLNFINDCPKEPHIPIYMIIGGCFGLIRITWMLRSQIRLLRYERLNPRDDNDNTFCSSGAWRTCLFILSAFLAGWFIVGNYWILRIYWPDHEPTIYKPKNWCQRPLYVFSVVHLIVVYCVLVLVLIVVIIMAIIKICILRCH